MRNQQPSRNDRVEIEMRAGIHRVGAADARSTITHQAAHNA